MTSIEPAAISGSLTPPAVPAVAGAAGGRVRAATGVVERTGTIPALEGVRGVAASLVFLVHFHAAFGATLPSGSALAGLSDLLARVGYHGVDVFFVLSGFLIYGALVGKPAPYGAFLLRRARRIYPTFLAVLALYLVLGALMPSRSKLPPDGAWLAVLQNALLLPGVTRGEPIVTVAWSLSYEIFFYAGITALVAVLALRRWPPRARVALFAGLLVLWFVGGREADRIARDFVLFVPGILVWELARLRPGGEAPARWLEPAAAAAFLAMLAAIPALDALVLANPHGPAWWAARLGRFVVLTGSISLLLYALATRRGGPLASIAGWAPVRYLGTVSYSFYLIHGLTINAAALALRPWTSSLLVETAAWLYVPLLVATYVCCVVTATALFAAVERPLSLTR